MKIRHILCALLVAAIWGFNFIVVKTGLTEMPPFLYASCRFLIACLPALFFIKKPAVSWSLILSIGVFSGVAKFGLLFMGIHEGVSGGLASLIFQSQAFFTTILSILLLKDKLKWHQAVGMFIALAGILVIGLNSPGHSTLFGFLLILGAAMSWSIANILFKRAGQVDMYSLIVWTSLIPPLPLYLFSLVLDGPRALPDMLSQMSGLSWCCLLFTACASTWLGSTLWAVLLRNYNASLVAPYSLLIPVFGLAFGYIFLGEKFTPLTYGACGLVFAGLVINQWNALRYHGTIEHLPVRIKPALKKVA